MAQEVMEGGEKRALWTLIALLPALLYVPLYYLRELDDNRLVSWRWVFRHVEADGFFITLVLCCLLAIMLASLELPRGRGVFVISLIAGGLFVNTPEVIIDASRYFTQAKHLELYGPGYFISNWGGEIGAWTDMPLMSFIYGMGFRLVGEHRWVVQIIVLVMFALAVLMTYRLGSEMFSSPRAGSLAALMLLSVPYLYTQVPLMMVDVPAMLMLTLSVYAFRRGLLTGGAWMWLWAPLSLFAAFFVKYSLWVMLSVSVVILALAMMEAGRVTTKRAVITALVFALLSSPLMWLWRDVMASQVDLLVTYQKPGLARWGESLFSTFFFHTHPLVTFLAICSLWYALRRRDRWLLVPVWLIALVIIVLGVRRIRYTLVIFPMLALMAGYALDRLGLSEKSVKVLAFSTLAASMVLALTAFGPFLAINSLGNLKSAGDYLDRTDIRVVEVKTLPQKSRVNPSVAVPLLDLYTHKRIVYSYDKSQLPIAEDIVKTSSFRFTWTYENLSYYKGSLEGDSPGALVLIGPVESELRGYGEPSAGFYAHEGVFRYRPLVTLYINTIDK